MGSVDAVRFPIVLILVCFGVMGLAQGAVGIAALLDGLAPMPVLASGALYNRSPFAFIPIVLFGCSLYLLLQSLERSDISTRAKLLMGSPVLLGVMGFLVSQSERTWLTNLIGKYDASGGLWLGAESVIAVGLTVLTAASFALLCTWALRRSIGFHTGQGLLGSWLAMGLLLVAFGSADSYRIFFIGGGMPSLSPLAAGAVRWLVPLSVVLSIAGAVCLAMALVRDVWWRTAWSVQSRTRCLGCGYSQSEAQRCPECGLRTCDDCEIRLV